MNTKNLIYAATGIALAAIFFYRRFYIPLTRPEFKCSKCGCRLWSVKIFEVFPRSYNAPSKLTPCRLFGLWTTRRYVHEVRRRVHCYRWGCGNDWDMIGKSDTALLSSFRYNWLVRPYKWWQPYKPTVKLR